MFERYTEKARRVIFFARYEASQFGSHRIESEHMLLGFLKENKVFARDLVRDLNVEAIRQEIERATARGEPVATSVDLPLSNECKRVLAYAAEEAEQFVQGYIGSEHLFLGLLREKGCFAARLLKERGVTLENARAALANDISSGRAEDGSPGVTTARASVQRSPGEPRVLMRRTIVFEDEDRRVEVGETFSLDVPRIGEEVLFQNVRGRVTRVQYHYRAAEQEIHMAKSELAVEKVVVSLKLLEQ